MTTVGFAIVSHDEPDRLRRLVRTLDAVYEQPPIVCHHDFSQCPIETATIGSSVHFVRPHVETKWGDINTLIAAVKAVRTLQELHDPDWIFLLSGSCYPTKPGREVRQALSSMPFDALLDHRTLVPRHTRRYGQPDERGFNDPAWRNLAYDRYVAHHVSLPFPRHPLRAPARLSIRMRRVAVRPRLLTWSANHVRVPVVAGRWRWRFYGGDFWFTANRSAITSLLDAPPSLWRHYQSRPSPDESLIHTLLCNDRGLRVAESNKRFAVWRTGAAHPNWLELADVPDIVRSDAFFARKFRADSDALNFIDEHLLGI